MVTRGAIVLVKFGEPVLPVRAAVGDYSMWFQRAIPDEALSLVDMRSPDEALPEDAAGFIVMGSPLAVYDPHPWRERALEVARRLLAGDKPTLGVCFGHQLFAVAAGGEVARNDRVEVGTVDVRLNEAAADDPLFGPFGGSARVNASHDDTVTRLPESAEILGVSERDRHQVLRWGEQVWSIQFHPEMRQAETRLAIGWRASRIEAEGGDAEEVRAAVEEAPDGIDLLRRFVALVRGKSA